MNQKNKSILNADIRDIKTDVAYHCHSKSKYQNIPNWWLNYQVNDYQKDKYSDKQYVKTYGMHINHFDGTTTYYPDGYKTKGKLFVGKYVHD